MKQLPMCTAVKTRRAATLERVRELPETMRAGGKFNRQVQLSQ
jgi:hypothetical protein